MLLRTPVGHRQSLDRPSRIHLIPALTGIVFLRRKVGGRILNIRWVIPMAAALYAIQPLSGRSLDDYSLRIFAVAFAGLALLHRLHYEWVKARGLPVWHSYDRGTSWLAFLPVPPIILHLLIDPALCGYLGWEVTWHYSVWLGNWLMIAAGMLCVTELQDFRNAWHRAHDLSDAEIESRQQAEALTTRRTRSEGGASPAPAVRARPRRRHWFARRS